MRKAFWFFTLMCANFAFAQSSKMPVSVSLEAGLMTAWPTMGEKAHPFERAITAYAGEGATVGATVEAGNRHKVWGGVRISSFNPRMGLDFPQISTLRTSLYRLETAAGYKYSLPVSDQQALLLGAGLSLDFYGMNKDDNLSLGQHISHPLIQGEMLAVNGVWNQTRNVSVALELLVEMEHRLSEKNVFFWGIRGHLSPFAVREGWASVTSPTLSTFPRDFAVTGTSVAAHVGLKIGGQSAAFASCEDCPRKQNRSGDRTFFAELGGTGLLASLNYDRRFRPFKNENWAMAGRVGVGAIPDGSLVIPLGVSFLRGRRKSHFETGAGITLNMWQLLELAVSDESPSYFTTFLPGISAGYRFQKPKGGFFFKASGHLMYEVFDNYLIPWAGIGFGYTLRK